MTDAATALPCSHFTQEPAASYLCCPLTVQGQVIGLLHMRAAAGTEGARWTRLAQVCTSLGNAFKLALTNIRLRAGRQG